MSGESDLKVLNRRGRGELPQRSRRVLRWSSMGIKNINRARGVAQDGELRSPGQTRASAPTQDEAADSRRALLA